MQGPAAGAQKLQSSMSPAAGHDWQQGDDRTAVFNAAALSLGPCCLCTGAAAGSRPLSGAQPSKLRMPQGVDIAAALCLIDASQHAGNHSCWVQVARRYRWEQAPQRGIPRAGDGGAALCLTDASQQASSRS